MMCLDSCTGGSASSAMAKLYVPPPAPKLRPASDPMLVEPFSLEDSAFELDDFCMEPALFAASPSMRPAASPKEVPVECPAAPRLRPASFPMEVEPFTLPEAFSLSFDEEAFSLSFDEAPASSLDILKAATASLAEPLACPAAPRLRAARDPIMVVEPFLLPEAFDLDLDQPEEEFSLDCEPAYASNSSDGLSSPEAFDLDWADEAEDTVSLSSIDSSDKTSVTMGSKGKLSFDWSLSRQTTAEPGDENRLEDLDLDDFLFSRQASMQAGADSIPAMAHSKAFDLGLAALSFSLDSFAAAA